MSLLTAIVACTAAFLAVGMVWRRANGPEPGLDQRVTDVSDDMDSRPFTDEVSVPQVVTWTTESAERSHPGRKRSSNQDAVFSDPELGLFVVADGMGGHQGGERASEMVVEALAALSRAPMPVLFRRPDVLVQAVESANRSILAMAARQKMLAGMGSTVTAMWMAREESLLVLAHVGDSRCYRLRGGRLECLTEDHVADERSGAHAGRLTRAVGVRNAIDVDTRIERVEPGDMYLLCSDGLTRMVDEVQIESVLRSSSELDVAADALISRANRAGGRDNISVVLMAARRLSASRSDDEVDWDADTEEVEVTATDVPLGSR